MGRAKRNPSGRIAAALVITITIAACGTKPARNTSSSPASSQSRTGGYYLDDGPGANAPANLDQIPDAIPRAEPLHRFANRPYTVLGRDYVPATALRPYKERGIASWYGRKFHQQRTSNGETYDMYGMTAAHPTLPLPSYARVTNLANNRSVVVRVNDRGPFLHGRIVDLSYAAAQKLGFAGQGSARVEVESLLPEGGGVLATRSSSTPAALPPLAAVTPPALPAPLALPAPRDLPLRIEGANVYFQLGAFATLDNAENFLALMEFQLSGNPGNANGTTGIFYAPRIRSRDNLFRVELGPYASRDEAQRAAHELESRFGVVPSARPR